MNPAAGTSAVRIREGQELFDRLAVACSDARVYSTKHPRFLDNCQSFVDGLQAYFDAHDDQSQLLFVCRNGQIWFRKIPLRILTPPAIKLLRIFQSRAVEGIRFAPGCQLSAIIAAVGALHEADAGDSEPTWRVLNRKLDAGGVREQISFFADEELVDIAASGGVLATEDEVVALPLGVLELPWLEVPLQIYQNGIAALHDLMVELGAGSNPRFSGIVEVASRIADGVTQDEHSYLPLASVEYSDHFTYNHSVNVCLLAVSALRPLVTNPERLAKIGQAALLHDVGKSLVGEDVFYSGRVPCGDERRAIERHTTFGAEILQDASEVDAIAGIVAHDHHRRADGSGYPRSRTRRPVDIITSLIAAADIFEAVLAGRPYKPRLSVPEAFEIFLALPESRGLEASARLLFDALSPFPPGSYVELESGDIAIVTRSHRDAPASPIVRLVVDEDGHLASEDVDLAHPDLTLPKVRRAIRSPIRGRGADENDSDAEFRGHVERGTLLATEG